MAEDLTRMWRNFSLTEEESVEVEIHEQTLEGIANREQSYLMGKLVADKIKSDAV